jgi:hypothetical protein
MKTSRLLLTLLLVSAALSGCLSTSLVYNPNIYQTGRAGGRGQVKVHVGVTAASTIESSDVTDATNTRDSIETKWGGNNRVGLDFAAAISYGLSERLGLGVSLSVASIEMISLRPYVKFMLTDPARRFAVSILPAVALVAGSKDSEGLPYDAGTAEIRSHLTAFELHFPASLRTSPAFEWTFTPRVVRLTYTANYDYSAGSGSLVPSFAIENQEDVTGFGAAFGFVWKGVHPELSFLASEEHRPLFAVGIGAHP